MYIFLKRNVQFSRSFFLSGRLVRSPAFCFCRFAIYTPILHYLISVSIAITLHIKGKLYVFFALQEAESVEQIALVDVYIR